MAKSIYNGPNRMDEFIVWYYNHPEMTRSNASGKSGPNDFGYVAYPLLYNRYIMT